MKYIDLQTLGYLDHEWGGPGMRDPQKFAETMGYFGFGEIKMKSEEEYISDLRKNNVQACIFNTCWGYMGWHDMGEIRARHDYIADLKKRYPEDILGFWVGIDPQLGLKGLRELERCISMGSFGVAFCGACSGVPANDKQCWPFYEVCIEADVPLKIWQGQLAIPGRITLTTENPIPYVDDVANRFPDAKIIIAHHPWPFLEEAISVLTRHPNVYNEQHGTLPRYFREYFKQEIRTRIKNKVMLGIDYPLFPIERVIEDWHNEDYKPEILEKVMYKNAARLLGLPED